MVVAGQRLIWRDVRSLQDNVSFGKCVVVAVQRLIWRNMCLLQDNVSFREREGCNSTMESISNIGTIKFETEIGAIFVENRKFALGPQKMWKIDTIFFYN